MQRIDNNTYIAHCQRFPADHSQEPVADGRVDACERLLIVLSSGLLIVGGPTTMDAVAQASVASLRILLEICHFGLVAYQIFGR